MNFFNNVKNAKNFVIFPLIAFVVIISFSSIHAQQLNATSNAATKIDAPQILPNHVPSEVRRGLAMRVASANPNQVMELRIGMSSKNPVGLKNFINEVYDPKSPNYHKFLTAQEFNQLYGASSVDSSLVIENLKSLGLTYEGQSKNGFLIKVKGSVSAVQSAFNVNIGIYKRKDGSTFYSPKENPTVPQLIKGKVAAIIGMDNAIRFHPYYHRGNLLMPHAAVSVSLAAPAVRSAPLVSPAPAPKTYAAIIGGVLRTSNVSLKPQTCSTSAPAGLTVVPSSLNALLYWNASNGATSYNIYRATSPSGPFTTPVTNVTTTDYTDYPLVNGTTYYYEVTAVGSCESGDSNQASVVPFAFRGIGGTMGPADIQDAYNLSSVASTGNTQVLGLYELDGYTAADINATTNLPANCNGTTIPCNPSFETYYSLPNVPLTNIYTDGFNGTPGANEDEVILDIDMAIATSPGLSGIRLYETSGDGNSWVDQWDNIANDPDCPKVISVSWGGDEADFYDSFTQGYLAQLASQGVAVVVAAGDAGAYAICDNGTNPPNCTYDGVPAVLNSTVFEDAFPSPTYSEPSYGENIFNTLQTTDQYINSQGQVTADLSSLTVQETLLSQFTDSGEAQTIYNILGEAQTAEAATPAVNYPASDANVTSVGISILSVNNAGTSSEAYSGEKASLYGGGGVSTLISMPSYQTTAATNYYNTTSHVFGSTTMRNVPDVSFTADPATAYGIYVDDGTPGWYPFWGSSAAAPIWAAFIARVNQGRVAEGQSAIGFLNPYLYEIVQNAGDYANDLHDITAGINNSYPNFSGNDYYPAQTGYDDVSGLGSFNGASLYTELLGPAAPTGLSATVESATVVQLNWTASSGEVASYNVYRTTTISSALPGFTGSTYTLVSTSGSVTTNSFTDSNLSTGTTYYYVVSAVNNGNVEGPYSSQTSATPAVSSYTVTVAASPSADGSVTCGNNSTACTSPVNGGTAITFYANPNAGYALSSWVVAGSSAGAGCSGTTGTCVVTITADTTVTANFVQTYTLTAAAAPSADGTVTCGNNSTACSSPVGTGTAITFYANPNAGYTLSSWSVTGSAPGAGCSGTTGTCAVTITANTTVTANFIATYTVTASASPSADGTVTCGNNSTACTSPVNTGTAITFYANPNAGYVLSSWTVAGSSAGAGCSGTTGTCAVTITGNTTVTANFTPTPETLTVAASPSADGSVTCGNNSTACTSPVSGGTSITFYANPNAGYALSSWSVTGSTPGAGCSGTSGTCTVIITASTSVTANFVQTYTLTAAAAPSADGTVTCGNNSTACSSPVGTGTAITFYANPNAGYTLSSWSVTGSAPGAGCSGTTGTCAVTITANTTVTANFIATYTVTASASPSADGTVTCGNNSTACTSPVNTGTAITFYANPNAGYVLSSWTVAGSSAGAGCSGTTGTCAVTITANTIVTASFIPVPETLTVAASPSATGTVTCGNNSTACTSPVSGGTSVTFYANPNAGYALSSWSVTGSTPGAGCSGTSGTCTVIITASTSVTANFVQTYTVTAVAAPSADGTVTCGNNSTACSSPVGTGTAITFYANPNTGYALSSWTVAGSSAGAGCSGTTGTCAVTITTNTTVTANFIPILETLTVTASPSSEGTVTCGNNSTVCSNSVIQGTPITFYANPNSGYALSSWTVSGSSAGVGCSGTTGTCMVTINADTDVTANFSQTQVAAPTGFNATILAARVGGHTVYGAVSLVWAQSSTAGVIRNSIYRSVNGGGYSLYTTVSPSTSYSDKNVTNGVTYTYRVTASTNESESSPSNSATIIY